MTGEQLRLVRAAGVLSRTVGGEVLVTTQESEDFTSISGTGALIWAALEAPIAVSDVIARVAQVCGVSKQATADEILSCLEDLMSRGILVQVTDDERTNPATEAS